MNSLNIVATLQNTGKGQDARRGTLVRIMNSQCYLLLFLDC